MLPVNRHRFDLASDPLPGVSRAATAWAESGSRGSVKQVSDVVTTVCRVTRVATG